MDIINKVFQVYQDVINNAASSAIHLKETLGSLGIEVNVTPISGVKASPSLKVYETKFSVTVFNSLNGRIAGIDNHENKPLHQHPSVTSYDILSGNYNLAEIGSYAFINFLPRAI